MACTQIQLTDHQAEQLKILANQRNISIDQMIHGAIEVLLESRSVTHEADCRRRAMEATGRFASGNKDISQNHDRDLAEAYQS